MNDRPMLFDNQQLLQVQNNSVMRSISIRILSHMHSSRVEPVVQKASDLLNEKRMTTRNYTLNNLRFSQILCNHSSFFNEDLVRSFVLAYLSLVAIVRQLHNFNFNYLMTFFEEPMNQTLSLLPVTKLTVVSLLKISSMG